MSATASPRIGVRLMTVNIHKGFSSLNRRFILPALRDAVRTVGADVVLLQEVHGRHDGHEKRVAHWPTAPHYEFLADSVWSDFAYGRNAVYPDGDHGNAVLSKFPIVQWDNHDVSQEHSIERRGMLHCALQLPGRLERLHVFCVHLGLRERDRQRQVQRLLELIRLRVPSEAPLVIGGDFNDWRHLAHRKLLAFGLQEVNQTAQGRVARTFPARWPVLPLDRIYVRNLQQQSPLPLPKRPWAQLSDHAPLAAQFEP